MFPTLIEFEVFGRPLGIHGYGLMIGIGFFLWTLIVNKESDRRQLAAMRDGMTTTTLLIGFCLFAGGKGLYLITQSGRSFTEAFDFQVGFVFWGSLILTIPVLYFRFKQLKIPIAQGYDILLIGVPLAHSFGRIGCFLAGCCYGHHCELPWAVNFEAGKGLNGHDLHPVQIYEAIGLMALFAYLWGWLRPRQKYAGQISFHYMIFYSALRCVTEIFRGDPGRRFIFHEGEALAGEPPYGISTSVFISFIMLLVSGGIWWWMKSRGKLTPLTPASTPQA